MQLLKLNIQTDKSNDPVLEEVPQLPSVEAQIEYGRAASEGGYTVMMGANLLPQCVDGRVETPFYQLFAHDGNVTSHNLS